MSLRARAVVIRLLWVSALAAFGIVWRMAPLELPYAWWSTGGNVIWGAMLVPPAGALCGGASRFATTGLIAAAIAVAAEYQRLWHSASLDTFRASLAGALLLGRVFNPRHIVAYWAGILIALLAQTVWTWRKRLARP
jgi:hypothetical protein